MDLYGKNYFLSETINLNKFVEELNFKLNDNCKETIRKSGLSEQDFDILVRLELASNFTNLYPDFIERLSKELKISKSKLIADLYIKYKNVFIKYNNYFHLSIHIDSKKLLKNEDEDDPDWPLNIIFDMSFEIKDLNTLEVYGLHGKKYYDKSGKIYYDLNDETTGTGFSWYDISLR
jgi:hypothetical protein